MDKTSIKVALECLDIFALVKTNLERVAETYGVTAQQIHILYRLYREGDMLMGVAAKQLHCDASNITGLVDRLVQHGFIERQAMPDDRRAKLLHLTPGGKQLMLQLLSQLPSCFGVDATKPEEAAYISAFRDRLKQPPAMTH